MSLSTWLFNPPLLRNPSPPPPFSFSLNRIAQPSIARGEAYVQSALLNLPSRQSVIVLI